MLLWHGSAYVSQEWLGSFGRSWDVNKISKLLRISILND
jgi:hypothetical protein